MRLRLRCVVALAWLAGCTVGPDYHPPAPKPPGFASLSPVVSDAPLPAGWWRLYADPVLDALVRQALVANQDLQVATQNLAASRAILDEARAGRLPATLFTAGAGYGVSSPALTGFDIFGLNPRADSIYELGLDVSWEIDLFGRVRRSIEAARADYQAAEAARDFVVVTVAAETARAYADACSSAEQVVVQRRSLAVAQRSLGLTQDRADAGAAGPFEVKRAAALVESTRAGIPPLESQHAVALFRLAVLTGRPPEADLGAAAACATPPVLKQPIPVGDAAALLRRRPDLREAERRLAAQTALVGVAVAELYPRIDLAASFAALSPTIAGIGSAANQLWQLGSAVSWNFPVQSAARARVRQARAEAGASLAAFDGAVLAALRDVEQALAAEASEIQRRAAISGARDRDAEALRIAEDRYAAGSITFLDRLDSERTLIADEAALAASDAALANDQVLLFKALGGGWEPL